MATRVLKPGVILAVLIALVPQANAGGHHHGGSSFSFGFGGFFPAAPYYSYYPAYYPPPYYYAPPVAYLPPPAAVPAPQATPGSQVGQGCREYTAPVSVDGRVVDTYGTACPMGDGSWRIIN